MITAGGALLLVVGLLWACTSDYETFEPPPLDYSDREPLELAVERVAVDSAYRPAGAPPYIDHVTLVSPEAATRALLMQRLQALGGTDRLQAVILEAAAGPGLRPEPQLCTVLAGVVATEAEGFARLRSRRLGADSWVGRTTLPGTERCTIEGAAWPRARYQCVGPPLGGDGRASAELAFDALARELEQCLEKPIWFPRDWRPGERFEFAMGERLQAWTDRTTFPPSQVVLKVQQDAAGPTYRVKLDLEAVP